MKQLLWLIILPVFFSCSNGNQSGKINATTNNTPHKTYTTLEQLRLNGPVKKMTCQIGWAVYGANGQYTMDKKLDETIDSFDKDGYACTHTFLNFFDSNAAPVTSKSSHTETALYSDVSINGKHSYTIKDFFTAPNVLVEQILAGEKDSIIRSETTTTYINGTQQYRSISYGHIDSAYPDTSITNSIVNGDTLTITTLRGAKETTCQDIVIEKDAQGNPLKRLQIIGEGKTGITIYTYEYY